MNYTVAAVDEAIKLLFLVARQPDLGLTELARRSGITKPRAFRLLTTLEQRELVRRKGDPAVYALSFKALHLGSAAQAQIDLVRAVQEPIQRLGDAFNETVVVRVRDGIETVSIAHRDSTHSLRVHGDRGARRPLYAGAANKLLLAFAPADVQEAVFALDRKQFTASTPAAASVLKEELRRIRESDYAISRGERTPDAYSIAVPIRDASSEVIGAMSISAPAGRMPETRIEQYLAALRAEAIEISRRLGHVAQGTPEAMGRA